MNVLRIAVACADPARDDGYRNTVALLGHVLTYLVRTGDELKEKCLAEPPDLIIAEVQLGDPDGIKACKDLCRKKPIPVILVSESNDTKLMDRAAAEYYVLGYIMGPVIQQDLDCAIRMAWSRFAQFQEVIKEKDNLRQALEDRKVFERAKGLLMKRVGLSEPEAFRRLQKLARDLNRKLIDIANAIIVAEAAYEQSGAL